MFDRIIATVSKLDRTVLIGGAVAAVAVIGAGGYFLLGRTPEKPAEAHAQVIEDIAEGKCVPIETFEVTDADYVVGDRNAPVTLIEYLSQTCSHCAEFSKLEMPKVQSKFVEKGLVKVVFREMHRNNVDVAASLLGRCLGREAYLPFTEMLLDQQAVWMGREDGDIGAGLRDMARRAGMTSAEFDACLKKADVAKEVAAQSAKAAKDYCISGTPTLVLNGKKIEGEGTAYDKLEASIIAELKKAGKDVAASATPVPAEGVATDAAAAPAGTGASAAEAAAPAATAPADTKPADAKADKTGGKGN